MESGCSLTMLPPTAEDVETVSLLSRFFGGLAAIGAAMLTGFFALLKIGDRRNAAALGVANERIASVETSLDTKASIASVDNVAAEVRRLGDGQQALVDRVGAMDSKIENIGSSVQHAIAARRDDVDAIKQLFANQREDSIRTTDAIAGMTRAVSDYTVKVVEGMGDRPTRAEVREMVKKK